MPEKWNRKTRRKMSNLGIGQKIVEEQLQKTYQEARQYAIREAWSAMMLALHQDNGFDLEALHRLAVSTINNINRHLGPTDMAEELKKLTGFDVDEPIDDDELDPFGVPDPEDMEASE